MLYGPEVHPYHLLRYDRVIFSKPALEKLQESLKASAPKRKAEVA
jgi:large subunit ribosomal protein L4